MAKLTTKQRKKLPDSDFALEKERKYPLSNAKGKPSRTHAANAKARAQQQFDNGNISKTTLAKIDKEANKVLKKTESKKKSSSKAKK